jgi:hypothetical protein
MVMLQVLGVTWDRSVVNFLEALQLPRSTSSLPQKTIRPPRGLKYVPKWFPGVYQVAP